MLIKHSGVGCAPGGEGRGRERGYSWINNLKGGEGGLFLQARLVLCTVVSAASMDGCPLCGPPQTAPDNEEASSGSFALVKRCEPCYVS